MRAWALIAVLLAVAVLFWIDYRERHGQTIDLVIPANDPALKKGQ